MTNEIRYNPLAFENLGESIVRAMLDREALPLRHLPKFDGAGVYGLYYIGEAMPFAPYDSIAEPNRHGAFRQPIYVGKAENGATRIGNQGRTARTDALHGRLNNHRISIDRVSNLDLDDVHYRALNLEDAFIGLGEARLIETFQPLWNTLIYGFGSNAAGGGRELGKRSRWGTLHPGRPGADRLRPNDLSAIEIIDLIQSTFRGWIPEPVNDEETMEQAIREATSDEG